MSAGNGKPVLALDFDGVISRSLLEAYLLTWNVAGKVDSSLAHQLEIAPDIDSIHDFQASHREHWDAFERLVPYGNRSEDYLVIQTAVEQQAAISSQEEFTAFKNTVDPELQEAFHREFYVIRYCFAEDEREKWLALNAPYPGVTKAVVRHAESFNLCVATSKDRETVIALLESWGLLGLFGNGRVLDKRAGASKQAHLRAISEMFSCPFERITFVDDKVSHLLDCSGLGARLLLAGWGYNGPNEHEQARHAGFPVLDLASFAELSA